MEFNLLLLIPDLVPIAHNPIKLGPKRALIRISKHRNLTQRLDSIPQQLLGQPDRKRNLFLANRQGKQRRWVTSLPLKHVPPFVVSESICAVRREGKDELFQFLFPGGRSRPIRRLVI